MMKKKVAIITRTKDRDLLLTRARESVESQIFKDFVWVLINDAGAKEYVDEQAEIAKSNGVDVKVIHRKKSLGMEAASNNGITVSDSEYIVIHDDDDSWKPEFLEKTVAFLDSKPHYLAVATHSTRVNETIKGGVVRIKDTRPYNSSLQCVHIVEMAKCNRIPPISMLFRKSLYDELDGFDETMPVLGDWDFVMRTLVKGDIGIIPEELANYHIRKKLEEGDEIYGNTVTSGVDKHIEYNAIYRNRKFRDFINNNDPVGLIVNIPHIVNYSEYLLERIHKKVSKRNTFSRLIRKLRGKG